MNKRGFIFTFISVTLVSVILLAFLIQYTMRTRAEIEKTNTEIETMNAFVKALNNDYLPRALKVSENQAILALLHHMSVNDRYAGQNLDGEDEDDIGRIQIKKIIINAMVDGKYKNGWGIPNAPKLELMEVNGISYNLSSVLNEIVNLANFTGITFDFDEIDKDEMNIIQDNPWYINVTMRITYNIKNKNNDISWSYTNKEIKTSIPVFYFRDPIYLVAVAGDEDPEDGINITINKSVYTLPSQINEHAENTVFIKCAQAPDFLMRMRGNYQASENGIESLVNVKSSTQSVIDYQYILRINLDLDPVQIEQSGYYIDRTHLGCYGIGG